MGRDVSTKEKQVQIRHLIKDADFDHSGQIHFIDADVHVDADIDIDVAIDIDIDMMST